MNLLVAVVFAFSGCSQAKDMSHDGGESKEKIIGSLHNSDWETRDNAVTTVLYKKQELLKDKNVASAAIKLLNQEIQKMEDYSRQGLSIYPEAEKYGEAYGEYIIDLLDMVGKTHDPRSIPVLVKAVKWGRGVRLDLAWFGDQAVDPLIAALKSSQDEDRRWGCVDTFSELSERNISPESVNKIKAALKDLIHDKNQNVRNAARNALKSLESTH